MATNMSRRFTSLVAASRQTLASSISVFESETTSQSNSITRFFCSSPNQEQQDQSQSKLTVEAKVTSQKESDNEGNDEEDADDDDDGDGVYVNKETGEIGGPRGPEPTRYGDWEKGGRCSDF